MNQPVASVDQTSITGRTRLGWIHLLGGQVRGEHERKCRGCGNVAIHEDNVMPHVLCAKCGSQDTRPMRAPDAKESVPAEIALACAKKSPDDYWGQVEAIRSVLERFGIDHMQRPRQQA